MANNRLVLVCQVCSLGEYIIESDDHYVLAKYYPSTGYYTPGLDTDGFNAWLDRHRHEDTPWAEGPYRLAYELAPDTPLHEGG